MAVSQQSVFVFALGAVASCAAASDHSVLPSFSSFIQRYGRAYRENSEEYSLRQKIYESRLLNVHHQNSQPGRIWEAAVNHLTDRTEDELSQLRGLRPMRTSKKAPGAVRAHKSSGNFLSQVRSEVLPDEISWAHLNAVKADNNQGGCGSCWAVATATMLGANAEISGVNRTFSAQELVNCVPNPHNCGGSGGCKGSTTELAMNWVVDQGLETESSTPYKGSDDTCGKTGTSLMSVDDHKYSAEQLEEMIAVGVHAVKQQHSTFPTFQGWERLPENEYQPLVSAVANRGPVAVSVGADGWSLYGKGVFDGCSKDSTIDHAVVLIGYGTDKESSQKYFIIKNSWGNSWGEDGTIRLLRHEGDGAYCGTDYSPEDGTACDGGPSTVPVCGMCGILYDAVVPHFTKA